MNKSAEQQAEEYAKKSWGDPDDWMCDNKLDVKNCKEDFLSGHQSRDEEVGELKKELKVYEEISQNKSAVIRAATAEVKKLVDVLEDAYSIIEGMNIRGGLGNEIHSILKNHLDKAKEALKPYQVTK